MEKISLQYAYTTSVYAKKYNCGDGCWLVFNHNVAGVQNPAVFDQNQGREALSFFEACTNVDWSASFTRSSESLTRLSQDY